MTLKGTIILISEQNWPQNASNLNNTSADSPQWPITEHIINHNEVQIPVGMEQCFFGFLFLMQHVKFGNCTKMLKK